MWYPFKKYYAQTADQEDLISIGTIGLIKGVSTYRPEKNVRLATYASRCIENAILSPTRLWKRKCPPEGTAFRGTFRVYICDYFSSWLEMTICCT